MLDLQHVFRCLSNVLRDAVAVNGAEQECSQYQEIEGSGKNRWTGAASSHRVGKLPLQLVVCLPQNCWLREPRKLLFLPPLSSGVAWLLGADGVRFNHRPHTVERRCASGKQPWRVGDEPVVEEDDVLGRPSLGRAVAPECEDLGLTVVIGRHRASIQREDTNGRRQTSNISSRIIRYFVNIVRNPVGRDP